MRIVFMGTPEFAVPALEQLVASRNQVCGVYTRPDRSLGRGQHMAVPPLKKVAAGLGLPVFQPASLKDKTAIDQLVALAPDAIVTAAYGQILPPAVLDVPRLGSLNLHPSLLPRYRGPSPVASAILSGDEFTGVTVMLMDAGLDTGPVLAQAQVAIADSDTTAALTGKLARVGAFMLDETLGRWARGEITPRPQDGSSATYSKVIRKEDGEIDWRLPAWDIWRRVRAYQPWPGSFTYLGGRRLNVAEATPLKETVGAGAGEVVLLPGGTFGVGTGDGILVVTRIQLEGKRVMTGAEFLRGQRHLAGIRLPQH
ncbi:MAG: methionyl-tRNA formyltransferase [Dehalococcoidia bacterium]|nr:MAG: methionyl-tRNA formyltransferase [Dehalococcoidia bacterium]